MQDAETLGLRQARGARSSSGLNVQRPTTGFFWAAVRWQWFEAREVPPSIEGDAPCTFHISSICPRDRGPDRSLENLFLPSSAESDLLAFSAASPETVPASGSPPPCLAHALMPCLVAPFSSSSDPRWFDEAAPLVDVEDARRSCASIRPSSARAKRTDRSSVPSCRPASASTRSRRAVPSAVSRRRKRSRRRRIERATRRSAASDTLLCGSRPASWFGVSNRTPLARTPFGFPSPSSLSAHQPIELVPRSSPSRYFMSRFLRPPTILGRWHGKADRARDPPPMPRRLAVHAALRTMPGRSAVDVVPLRHSPVSYERELCQEKTVLTPTSYDRNLGPIMRCRCVAVDPLI